MSTNNLVNSTGHRSRYGSISHADMISTILSEERNPNERDKTYVEVVMERLFRLKERETTITDEVKAGCVHFVSIAFIMAVNPVLLAGAGYNRDSVAVATGLSTGAACILSGLISNLPFVIAPTTSTSLYYEVFLLNNKLSLHGGNFATLLLGVAFLCLSVRRVAVFTSDLVPFVLKAGICLGVGLLIALDALTSIDLVETGKYTITDMGTFTSKIWISILSFVIIALLMSRRVKGAFFIGIVFGSTLYWGLHPEDWPQVLFVHPSNFNFRLPFYFEEGELRSVFRLVGDLLFIGVILLNGLAQGLSDMARLRRSDGSTPRGKWLYALCGIGTIFSSFLGAGPLLISPESAPGLKAGAKTGLSVVVCGLLFIASVAIGPILASAPVAGTSPVLLMIGAILFENASKVNWTDVRESVPIFLVTAMVPFTNSLFYGVLCGLCMHIVFRLFSGSFWRRYAPSVVLDFASKCFMCVCFSNSRDSENVTYEQMGIRNNERERSMSRNVSAPLFFDNPYFDFEPSTSRLPPGVFSDGSGGLGIGMLSAHRNANKSETNLAYMEVYDAVSDLGGDEEDWYQGVPLSGEETFPLKKQEGSHS